MIERKQDIPLIEGPRQCFGSCRTAVKTRPHEILKKRSSTGLFNLWKTCLDLWERMVESTSSTRPVAHCQDRSVRSASRLGCHNVTKKAPIVASEGWGVITFRWSQADRRRPTASEIQENQKHTEKALARKLKRGRFLLREDNYHTAIPRNKKKQNTSVIASEVE